MREREQGSWDTTSEKPGPSKGEAYGMGAVTQALKGTSFPATKADLISRAGNEMISWTKGGPKMRLADLIRQAPEDNFPSMSNVVSAVSEAAKRTSSGQERR